MTESIMSVNSILNDLRGHLTRAREQASAVMPAGSHLWDVIHAAVDALSMESDESTAHRFSDPQMLVFGGMFQCRQIGNPDAGEPIDTEPVSDPQSVSDAAAQAASLFALALRLRLSSSPAASSPDASSLAALQDRLEQLAGYLCQQAGMEQSRLAPEVAKTRTAVEEMEASTRELEQLQSRREELEAGQKETQELIAQRGRQVEKLEADLAELSDEEAELTAKHDDLQSRFAAIEEVRRSCRELTEQIEQGERELPELEDRRRTLAEQAHDLQKKLEDSRHLVAEAEKSADEATARRIVEIWQTLPPDAFDTRLEKSRPGTSDNRQTQTR